jgi:hypothetical protein
VNREHDGSQSKDREHVKGGNIVATLCHMMSATDHPANVAQTSPVRNGGMPAVEKF